MVEEGVIDVEDQELLPEARLADLEGLVAPNALRDALEIQLIVLGRDHDRIAANVQIVDDAQVLRDRLLDVLFGIARHHRLLPGLHCRAITTGKHTAKKIKQDTRYT